ncbi:Six-hairpin glycosidase [Mycena kentingensis (nom. inval.)]|nr:Six-hairpin glycosidase [Mycena kentingensis (nom. inval.)]
MRGLVALLLPLLFVSSTSDAVIIRISRPQKSTGTRTTTGGPRPPKDISGTNLINKNNDRYTANISVNGRVVNVALDTGSTDLWVMPPEGLPSFNDTGLNATLRYGDGTDFVRGDIGVGEFKLDTYTIPFQGALHWAADAEDADFDDGIFGLMGLGFNTAGSSSVNDAVQAAFGSGEKWGQSVLQNIFDQTPGGENFIGIALSRTGDEEETAEASLAIAEYHVEHKTVANAPKITQNPVGSGAWTVTLDGLSINGKKISWPSTMRAAPTGKNIVHLDTGTTNIMMPSEQVDAIYSAIPGATFYRDSYIPLTKFSTTYDAWIVPCNATPVVVATFGGESYPLHPLDVTDMQVVTTPDGTTNYTVCVGTMTDVGNIVDGASDALFGDTFLRNVYTVFDFGTGGGKTETPFVQMLSVTDSSRSVQDHVDVRLEAMKSMPPEINTADIVRIFKGLMEPYGGTPARGSSSNSNNKGGAASSCTSSMLVGAASLALVLGLL